MKQNQIKESGLEQLYALIPRMKECKGLCRDGCTVVPSTPMEKKRIEKASGKEFRAVPHPIWSNRCSMLTDEGRCSHHPLRPFLCRAFGAVAHPLLVCRHGCEPERWLSYQEFVEISKAIELLGGKMVVQSPEGGFMNQDDSAGIGLRYFLGS